MVEIDGAVYDFEAGKEVLGKVKVPINPDKFVSTKNEFELTYLRWRYFMRTSNPSDELIRQYEKAAYKVAKEEFNQNYETMKTCGLEIEDVCNIALVHLVSYLGCYSLQFSKDGQAKAKEKSTTQLYPEEEIKRKDLSNMIIFIRQRMKDLVRVFRQKNKNVLGENHIAALFQLIDTEVPCTDFELLKSPKKYGYRAVTPSQYRQIRTKLGTHPQVGKFALDGISYRYVRMYISPVWLSDYENDDHISVFGTDPENVPQEKNYEISRRYKLERLLDRYEKLDNKRKIKLLKKAVNVLRKTNMIPELMLAKGMLDKLQFGKEK